MDGGKSGAGRAEDKALGLLEENQDEGGGGAGNNRLRVLRSRIWTERSLALI